MGSLLFIPIGEYMGVGATKGVLESFSFIKMAYSCNWNAAVGIINIFAGNKRVMLLMWGN